MNQSINVTEFYQRSLASNMKAVMWSKSNCHFCTQARALLRENGIEFEERKIGEGWTKHQLLEAVPNARTVPQIFLNGKLVGGYTELKLKLGKT